MGYRRYPVNNSLAIQRTEDSVAPSPNVDSDVPVLVDMAPAELDAYFDRLILLVLHESAPQ